MNQEELESSINTFFPIRSGLTPSFREFQKEAIIETGKNLFIEEKKFMAINAPTGSGKSAINVTLEKIAGLRSVYLTPLVTLQDQLMNEDWAGMSCIKGRSNYLCSVFGYDNEKFNCDYDGPVANTCNSCDKKRTTEKGDLEKISKDVDIINSMYSGKRNMIRMKTSFDSSSEFNSFVKRVQEAFDKEYETLVYTMENVSTTIQKREVLDYLCCDLGPRECPVKSSRLRAEFSDVVVMNPDVFFFLNKMPESIFRNVPMMVFDECQQIENVIGRLFKTRLPITSLKTMFGLDFSNIYEEKDEKKTITLFNAAVKNILGPLAAVGKTLFRLGDILKVSSFETIDSGKASNDMMRSFKGNCSLPLRQKYEDNPKWRFSWFLFLNNVFSGNSEPIKGLEFLYDAHLINGSFYDSVRTYFEKKCEELDCKDEFVEMFPDVIRNFTRILEVELTSLEDDAPREYIICQNIVQITDSIFRMVELINSINLITDPLSEKYPYVVFKGKDRKSAACTDITSILKYYKGNRTALGAEEQYIDVVPVDVGKIMNKFFYSCAEKVVLSSGTWVNPDRLFKIYGLPYDCSMIEVPSTFPAEKRPIYIIRQESNVTNFSEKDGKEYLYKTDAGIRKFIHELSFFINELREHIKKKHGENSNIVVHCHTFDIARKVAIHMPGMSEKIIVHIPEYSDPIRNLNGYVTHPIKKNMIIDYLSNHKNEGLTVVSCSMSEGVDLKYDIARGQIILKRPTPSMGDPYIKTMMKGNPLTNITPDPSYFTSVVFSTLIQQYGRIMRAKDDWGYTIVIDQSICIDISEILHPMNKMKRNLMNIDYFIQGIRYDIDKKGYPKFLWLPS